MYGRYDLFESNLNPLGDVRDYPTIAPYAREHFCLEWGTEIAFWVCSFDGWSGGKPDTIYELGCQPVAISIGVIPRRSKSPH